MDERQGLTDLDRALADALDVDVSPDFAARVRRRIATGAAPPRVRWRRQFAVAAAAVVIAATALAILSTRRPVTPLAPSAQLQPAASAWPLPDVRPAADVRPHPPVAETRPAFAGARLRVASASPSPSPSPTEPEVLVPRAEIEMYRRLIADAEQIPPAIVLEPQRIADLDRHVPVIEIDPIRIELIAPPAGAQGDRQ